MHTGTRALEIFTEQMFIRRMFTRLISIEQMLINKRQMQCINSTKTFTVKGSEIIRIQIMYIINIPKRRYNHL